MQPSDDVAQVRTKESIEFLRETLLKNPQFSFVGFFHIKFLRIFFSRSLYISSLLVCRSLFICVGLISYGYVSFVIFD